MRLLLRRIVGVSMQPALQDGQVVLAYSGYCASGMYGRGDVVIVAHDGRDKVKRIADTRAGMDGREIYLRGDNPEASTDSRDFGWLPEETIRGKVIWPIPVRMKKI
jgi:type IV secretory pathway protease TraF